ncbi:MAG: phosphopantothenoylcysteine decarboxylase, partial [Pseudomonadota bacterium]
MLRERVPPRRGRRPYVFCARSTALPADAAVFAAAVADWRVLQESASKVKKTPGAGPPPLELTE